VNWFFVQDERQTSSFNLHVNIQFSGHHLLNRLSFLQPIFLAPLSKIKWLYLSGLLSEFSILFHQSVSVLCQYHTVFVTWLYKVIWNQVLLCLQHCYFCSGLLYSVFYAAILILGLIFPFLWRMILGFDGDCVESVDRFQQGRHFHSTNSSDSWTWEVFQPTSVCFNFFFSVLAFIIEVFNISSWVYAQVFLSLLWMELFSWFP
jgi:hypothetical protein